MSGPLAATLNNATLKVNRTRFDYIRQDRPNTKEEGARKLPHTIGQKTKQMAGGNHKLEGHTNTTECSTHANHPYKSLESYFMHFRVILAHRSECLCKSENA